ncbi:protein BatD [Salmonella enterica subsp. enterica serovar Oslo]|nr:oxygen tolerance domain protein [Salmonella enterica]EBB9036825.1 protein BatD [Salmonella enterica subsp. enterica serovar Oslo]EAN4769829.1 oxygen tolerance domain protein [Salmonella enterica]EAS5669511.1 oxygen tolerance domain protein [Salmonella enterica]EAU4267430.1 oxygen tolerance domain protein [Salmonella enterica]
MKLLWLLLIAVLPCQAAMTVTRELIAPEQVVPGQPVSVAVTFWTDNWFNPPPQWPDFPVDNGALMTATQPNELLTRREGSTSWSGIRMVRQIAAWDQGTLRLPATELTLTATGQAPITVQLPVLEKRVNWPQGVQQPDRFLPASRLALSQKINLYHSSNDSTLRAGDVIERVVTADVKDVMPAQIPPLLYAIPGTHTQRLTPVNRMVTSGRGEIAGAQRVETLRYLPVEAGTVTLPPITLRWWDTSRQQWQTAALPGHKYQIAAAKNAGQESVLKGTSGSSSSQVALLVIIAFALFGLLFVYRHALLRSWRYLSHQCHRFWHPQSLPGQVPDKRSEG